jgi:hypothetical protein
MIMAGKAVPGMNGVRVFPPAPRGFDAFTASKTDLARYGIPQRPDPAKQPELAELWEQRARRYTGFTHLEPEFVRADEPPTPAVAGLGLFPLEACGFELTTNPGAPFLKLIGTWTVPHLNHSPDGGLPNRFRTFFGLGFLDVHVEMTVDTAQNNTALIRIHDGTQVMLPVDPGDAISATLCLENSAAGTARYFLANETTSQTVNLAIDTGFPPAVTINAGISRSQVGGPPGPLARFGVVYFDQLTAVATDGNRSLTDGVATAMVDTAGSTLASPQKLTDSAFKVTHVGL